MYQHIVVEAENLEEAGKKSTSDDIDWNTQEMGCESSHLQRRLVLRGCILTIRTGPFDRATASYIRQSPNLTPALTRLWAHIAAWLPATA